jgi:microcystin-dependent protein
MFCGNFAPQGWAMCDGSLVSIMGNDTLFALVGTSFGGDGITNFQLPDMRGRVPVGQGTYMPDNIQYTVGNTGGGETVTLVAANLPPHTHALAASTAAGTKDAVAGNVLASGPTGCNYMFAPTGAPGNALNAGHITSSGNSAAHPNMQPYLTVNYIIATAGIYPSRP